MRRTPAQKAFAPAFALAAALALCACAGKASPAKPDSPPAQGQGKMCGGIAGIRCAEGEYCKMDGPAHPDQAGVCRTKPQMCPMIWQPVCGSNGKTYPNACHAAREGVSVKPGACPK